MSLVQLCGHKVWEQTKWPGIINTISANKQICTLLDLLKNISWNVPRTQWVMVKCWKWLWANRKYANTTNRSVAESNAAPISQKNRLLQIIMHQVYVKRLTIYVFNFTSKLLTLFQRDYKNRQYNKKSTYLYPSCANG